MSKEIGRVVTDEVWDSWKGIPGVVEDSAQPQGNSQDRRGPRKITFGLADHDVAELALPSFIEALHLNVVGGLRLQVADGVPVPVPWEREWGSLCLFIATDQHRRHRRITW